MAYLVEGTLTELDQCHGAGEYAPLSPTSPSLTACVSLCSTPNDKASQHVFTGRNRVLATRQRPSRPRSRPSISPLHNPPDPHPTPHPQNPLPATNRKQIHQSSRTVPPQRRQRFQQRRQPHAPTLLPHLRANATERSRRHRHRPRRTLPLLPAQQIKHLRLLYPSAPKPERQRRAVEIREAGVLSPGSGGAGGELVGAGSGVRSEAISG